MERELYVGVGVTMQVGAIRRNRVTNEGEEFVLRTLRPEDTVGRVTRGIHISFQSMGGGFEMNSVVGEGMVEEDKMGHWDR